MENDTFEDSLCMICQDEDVNDLRDCKNGIESLIECSNIYNLNHLSSHLSTKLQEEATVKVHKKCQKNVGNLIRKRKADPTFNIDCAPKVAKVTTRGSVDGFNWIMQCLFYGRPCVVDPKHPDRRQYGLLPSCTTTTRYLNSVTRGKMMNGEHVRRHVINCCDLAHAEARYHEDSRTEFTRRKGKLSGRPAGRPINERQKDNFEKPCDWLECNSEIYSLEEIHNKMIEIAGSDIEVYTRPWMEKMLEKKVRFTYLLC